MRRLWIGIVFLAVLLAGGVWLSIGLSGVHDDLSAQLSAASHAVREENWTKAEALAESARATWEKYRPITAAFTDHAPLEQMDSLFGELSVCRHLALRADYAAVCSHLSQTARAIAESHTLTWWNLL